MFKALFHIPASTGGLSSLGRKTSALLTDTVALIREATTATTVANADEAGLSFDSLDTIR